MSASPLSRSLQISKFRAPAVLFWIALGIRILYMILAHTYRFTALEDHFHFGWEMGRIARALVEGYGYADPFAGHTGPTAWVPPLYPLILAGIFKVFGVYSTLSAWIAIAVNCLFSAITAMAVYELAGRCFNLKVARWSGWLWALYPAAMQYAVRWIWETTLTTMLFAIVLVLAVRMRGIGDDQRRPQGLRRWLCLGFLWALIALSNPTLLLFLPVCIGWILWGAPRPVLEIRRMVLGLLLFAACVAPWTWRNWSVFHAFIPMRSNLGVEMWRWNNPEANGISLGAPLAPVLQDPRYALYAKMGEIGYSKYQGELAKAFIRSHPGSFALLSLKRFYFYWASVPHPIDNHPWIEGMREFSYCFLSLAGLLGLGLAIKNRIPGAILFGGAFALLPLTYYFVSVQARFRHPLEPLIDILGVYLFQSATRR